MGTTMRGDRCCRYSWSRAEVSRCDVLILMCTTPTPYSYPLLCYIIIYFRISSSMEGAPPQGGGVIIRGGRLPPRRAAPRLRSHRRRYCDANAVVATPVMPTPSMQRQRRHQCSVAAIVAATVASSSTRPRHGGTDLAPS